MTKKNHAEPMSAEVRIERFQQGQRTAKQARRLRHAFGRTYKEALSFRGAVKTAKLKKLNALAMLVPGFVIPEDARQELAVKKGNTKR